MLISRVHIIISRILEIPIYTSIMSTIYPAHLRIAVRMARELARIYGKIGVNILDPEEVNHTTLADHDGRYILFFLNFEKPAIFIFHRHDPFGPLTHVIVAMIEAEFDDIPPYIMAVIERFAGRELNDGVDLGVVKLYHRYVSALDLGLLVETITAASHEFLFQQFEPVRSIDAEICFKLESEHCQEDEECVALEYNIMEQFESLGFYVEDMDLQNRPGIVRVGLWLIRILIGNHYLYTFTTGSMDTFLVVPHDFQLSKREAQGVKSFLMDCYPSRRPRLVRIVSSVHFNCRGDTIVKAVRSILAFYPNLLYVIPAGIDFSENQNLSSILSSSRQSSQDVSTQSSIDNVASIDTTRDVVYSKSCSQLILSHVNKIGCERGRQRVSILSAGIAVIRSDIEYQMDRLNSHRNLSLPLYPSEAILDPFNDRFKWKNHFASIYKKIVASWNEYASSVMLKVRTVDEVESISMKIPENKQMIVQPILDDKVTALIIIDKLASNWVYINPDNEAAGSKVIFKSIECIIKLKNNWLENYQGSAIKITSHYHRDYPLVHLAFGLHTIGSLFRYAVKLPSKLIYKERAFRKYCWLFCYQTQVSNQAENIRLGLIEDNGSLKVGAYLTDSSPVRFERSVVPTDQCMFCKRRGFSNLGRHLSMAHGGHSSAMNVRRHA